MIHSSTQESFDHIFRKAACTQLVRQAENMCQVGTAAEGDSINGEEALVLAISSIVFRLPLVPRFDRSDATRTYLTGEGTGRSFEKAHLGIGSLCCGALSQELLQVSPGLDMSTPYVVSTHCLPYLDVLKPGYVATYAVTTSDMIRMDATVCVCAHAPLGFVADVSDEVESGGELELF